MKSLTFLFSLLFLQVSSAIEVASLHPLMTDLLRKVGGDKIQVIEIGREGFDVHKFQPRSKDIAAMSRCPLIFASGKGIETYLTDLKDSLSGNQTIIEVGRTIPSQKVGGHDEVYACCPTHAHGSIDPHWWHNVRNMERAARVVESALSKADPTNKSYYKKRSKTTQQNLRQLDTWVKRTVSTIPKKHRHLVTSHAAFGYFCKAYGFKASFVQGLSREGEISSKQLQETIQTIRNEGIRAVFPEEFSNPKTLHQIAKSSGAVVSKPIWADGGIADYEKMIRTNVSHIVEALR